MNFKTLWADKRTRIALLAGSGLLVAFAAFVVAGAADDTPGWIPAPFAGGSEKAGTDGETVDGTSGTKAPASNTKPVSNNRPGDEANSDSDAPGTADTPADPNAPGSSPSDPPATGDPADKPAEKTMTVRIMYWNDTENKQASTSVAIGDVRWQPSDNKVESAVGKLVGLPFNKALTLVVLPDGAGGKRIEIPVTFTTDMISDSAGDAIHVEIKDGTVRVIGNAVDNFDVTLDRF